MGGCATPRIPMDVQGAKSRSMSNKGGLEECKEEEKEQYIPPGERLVTPADVVDLDPSMTVSSIVACVMWIGTISCGYTRMQSDPNRWNRPSHKSNCMGVFTLQW